MAKNKEIFFTLEGRTLFDSSSGGTLLTTGAEGSKLLMLYVSDATGTGITITIGGQVVIVKTALSAGDNLLDSIPLPLDSRGNKYLNISAGLDIDYSVTAGSVDIVGYVEDY